MVVFASMVTSWNSLFQALVSPIFSHPFKIIVYFLTLSMHCVTNHKYVVSSCSFWSQLWIFCHPQSIVWWPQMFNSMLNVCLNGMANDISWLKTMVQFAKTKTTKIFACFSFIQSKNSWFMCIFQQSNNQTSFLCVWSPNSSIWA